MRQDLRISMERLEVKVRHSVGMELLKLYDEGSSIRSDVVTMLITEANRPYITSC